jgi:hypothetical protein
MRQAQFFAAIHAAAGRLFAVPQGCVEHGHTFTFRHVIPSHRKVWVFRLKVKKAIIPVDDGPFQKLDNGYFIRRILEVQAAPGH